MIYLWRMVIFHSYVSLRGWMTNVVKHGCCPERRRMNSIGQIFYVETMASGSWHVLTDAPPKKKRCPCRGKSRFLLDANTPIYQGFQIFQSLSSFYKNRIELNLILFLNHFPTAEEIFVQDVVESNSGPSCGHTVEARSGTLWPRTLLLGRAWTGVWYGNHRQVSQGQWSWHSLKSISAPFKVQDVARLASGVNESTTVDIYWHPLILPSGYLT